MLFTSLMIILLAFFILLNSIAVIDEERRLAALGSFIGSLGILPGGVSPFKSKGRSIRNPSAPMEEPIAGLEILQEFVESSMPTGVAVAGGRMRKLITFQDTVLFDEKGYSIKPKARLFLSELARLINLSNYPVRIEGHTDDVRTLPKGIDSDWQLSTLRSLAVLRYLVETGKVAPHRLSAFGYGKHRPLAPNNSPLNRAKNRRVSLVLDAREEAMKENLEERFRQPAIYDFKGFLFKLFRRP